MRSNFLRLSAALLAAVSLVTAADVIVVNGDPPGQGFNNPASAAPVGGNPGTTVGQQALNVFQRAADLWGSKLVSKQPIVVIAFFLPLSCTATSGTLGAAGPYWYFRDAPPVNGGQPLAPNTWYPAALAEKLTRRDLTFEADPNDAFEIITFFNSNLGQPGCLTGNGWYYGLDNNEPANRVDLLAVVLHEFGHGLGFSVGPTGSSTGVRFQGFPSVWERFMQDQTTGKRWIDMTNTERAVSARNDGKLVWAGAFASNVVPSALNFRPELVALGAVNEVGQASFGGPFPMRLPGTVVAPADGGGLSPLDGCEPFPTSALPSIAGNFVLINRGNCTFAQKALNAQNAGAAAAIIANNAAGLLAPGGAGPTITIPTAGVTQALGNALRAAAAQAPVPAAFQLNTLLRAGTDANLPRLFAPATFQSGSSVSHWDVTASPNLLMEPSINPDLGSKVRNPWDLTLNLFKDIGW